jgi:hypothetical protein
MAAGQPMRSRADLLRGVHRHAPLPPDAATTAGPALSALTASLTSPDPAMRPADAAAALAAIQ